MILKRADDIQKQPPEVFCKKRSSQKFFKNSQENTCARVSSLKPKILLKRRLWHRCFPVNFAKFLKAPEHEYIFSKCSRNLNISGLC